MDNFIIDIRAEGIETLRMAMEIAFAMNSPGKKVLSYAIMPPKEKEEHYFNSRTTELKALVLRWTDDPSSSKIAVNLPFKLDVAGATDFAARWLAEQDYGPEPDHDGSNHKGWRMFTEDWGHVFHDRYAVCGIVPCWAWYGK